MIANNTEERHYYHKEPLLSIFTITNSKERNLGIEIGGHVVIKPLDKWLNVDNENKELWVLQEIREIIEPVPGKLMLNELVEEIRKLKKKGKKHEQTISKSQSLRHRQQRG